MRYPILHRPGRVALLALLLGTTLSLCACADHGPVASDDGRSDSNPGAALIRASVPATTARVTARAGRLDAGALKALRVQVAASEAALNRADYRTMIEQRPPRLIALRSDETGIPAEMLKDLGSAMIRSARDKVEIRGQYEMSGMQIGTAGNGQPYALIPYVAQISAGADTMKLRSVSLAVLDNGRWYLMALDNDDDLARLRRAYPEFASVDLPTART